MEPYSYPIEGITATASSSLNADYGPERTIDGSGLNDRGEHSADMADMWVSDVETNGVWIQYVFDDTYKLDQMRVWNFNTAFEDVLGWGLKDVTIEYTDNGTDWSVLRDITLNQGISADNYAANTVVDLEGALAQGLRVTTRNNWGELIDLYGLSEVQITRIIGYAREPQPVDGADDVDPGATLAWRVGREAAQHLVYVGESEDELTLADTANTNHYELGELGLELGRTYYWRIDEVNDAEIPSVWESDVWHFNTPEYVVVDDFESYTNDADTYSRVFQTWIDGAGYTVPVDVPGNGTGSFIGHDPAQGDIMETAIVHGGAQSAPIYYGNGGQSISEVDRTFDEPQNWTRAGIKSLSLWFYGPASNTGQLYVKINGQKVPYPGDAGDIARAAWLPFNIDLSEIEGAQNVTSLTIGVETTGANEGVVYVDDIRLYPLAPDLIVPAEPEVAGLLTHLRFDDGAGTIAADASGNGRDGTLVRAPEWVAGRLDGALQFRQGGHVLDDDAEDYLNGLEALTVCMWIKSNVVDTDQGALICQDPSGVDETITMRYDSSGVSFSGTNVLKVAVTSTGGVQQLESSSNLQTTEWQHICMTWKSGALLRLYVDGIEDTPTGRNNPNNTGPVSTCEKLIIGKGGKDELGSVGWDGLIDDVRIYDRVLSDGEILWLSGETEPRPKPF